MLRRVGSGHLAFGINTVGCGGCDFWSAEELAGACDGVECVNRFALIVCVLTACDSALDGDEMALVGVLVDRFRQLSECCQGHVVNRPVVSVDGEGEVHSGFVTRRVGESWGLGDSSDQMQIVHGVAFRAAVPGWRSLVKPCWRERNEVEWCTTVVCKGGGSRAVRQAQCHHRCGGRDGVPLQAIERWVTHARKAAAQRRPCHQSAKRNPKHHSETNHRHDPVQLGRGIHEVAALLIVVRCMFDSCT
jgi:hypothetical protein